MSLLDKPTFPSTTLLGAVYVVGLAFLYLVAYAWSLTLLWGWHVAPVLHVPLLNFKTALGMGLTLRLLMGSYSKTADVEWAGLLATLVVGWVLHMLG